MDHPYLAEKFGGQPKVSVMDKEEFQHNVDTMEMPRVTWAERTKGFIPLRVSQDKAGELGTSLGEMADVL